MKKIDITENTGWYASKWGISDFYDEAEKSLRAAIDSGEDFDTGWFGCKKEINYAKIVREEGEITVSVTCHMDDLWESDDLIFDALWRIEKITDGLPMEIIDSIRNAACDEQLDDHTTLSETLPGNASYEDIIAALNRLEGNADMDNTEMYDQLCEIVRSHVEYMRENGIDFTDGSEDDDEEM